MSLLQPAPETFDLFDDIILVSEGQIVYQGPRDHVVEFFESCGFKCPERKGTADFLQEVKEHQQPSIFTLFLFTLLASHIILINILYYSGYFTKRPRAILG